MKSNIYIELDNVFMIYLIQNLASFFFLLRKLICFWQKRYHPLIYSILELIESESKHIKTYYVFVFHMLVCNCSQTHHMFLDLHLSILRSQRDRLVDQVWTTRVKNHIPHDIWRLNEKKHTSVCCTLILRVMAPCSHRVVDSC